MKYVTEIILVTLIIGCLTAMIVILTNSCKNSNFSREPLPPDSDEQPSQQWDTIYWLNSNSASEFEWVLAPGIAKKGVIAPFNSLPPTHSPPCDAWGGLGALKDTISSAQTAFKTANNIPLEVWMRPRNLPVDAAHPDGPQFTKFSTTDDLIKQVEEALREFQKCAGVKVTGFVCVKEDNHISQHNSVNCDKLAAAFKKGVKLPNGENAKFGVLGSPGNMSLNITMAGGELYEPIYFLPNGCPNSADGTAYGTAMGKWVNKKAGSPGKGKISKNTPPTSTVFFGGASAGCPLEYDQLQNASDAFREKASPGVLPYLNLGLWS